MVERTDIVNPSISLILMVGTRYLTSLNHASSSSGWGTVLSMKGIGHDLIDTGAKAGISCEGYGACLTLEKTIIEVGLSAPPIGRSLLV